MNYHIEVLKFDSPRPSPPPRKSFKAEQSVWAMSVTRSETLRRVGKSDLHVQQLGCGGGGWANIKAPVAETEASINAAYAAGVRLFDTAPSCK